MSLTTTLANPDSKFSLFLQTIMHPTAVAKLLNQWNNHLHHQPTLKVDGVENPSLVGTAFDYAFRWHVLGDAWQDQTEALIASRGATHLDKRDSNGKRNRDIIGKLILLGCAKPQIIADICIVLAWYERIFREGAIPPEIAYAMGEPKLGPALLRCVPKPERDDVKQLLDSIDPIWQISDTSAMLEFNPNPIIPNAKYVGGADGDWILGDVLYDCKCSWKKRPFTEQHLKQVVAYGLLDWDDELQLKGLGWYYARQQTIISYPLDKLIRDVPGKRAELKAIIKQQYLDRVDMIARAKQKHVLNALVRHMELDMQAPIHELAYLLDDADYARLEELLESKHIARASNHTALNRMLKDSFWKHHGIPFEDDMEWQ